MLPYRSIRFTKKTFYFPPIVSNEMACLSKLILIEPKSGSIKFYSCRLRSLCEADASRSFGNVLSPVKFSAQSHLTSELLRFL
jgi:hypothetical protein